MCDTGLYIIFFGRRRRYKIIILHLFRAEDMALTQGDGNWLEPGTTLSTFVMRQEKCCDLATLYSLVVVLLSESVEAELAQLYRAGVQVSVDSREAFRSLNGPDETLSELLVALVGRQVEPVEAGVGPGVAVGVAPLLDGEQLGPVAAVQLLEAVHRHARCPRHELEAIGDLYLM